MDKLIRGLICEKRARVFIANTKDLVETARIKHDLWPTATAALGRTLSVTCVLGAMLKSDEEKLTVEINGGGELGTILTDAYPNGKVRGFVSNPHVLLINEKTNKLDVGKAVGNQGYLRVIKDVSLKDDFTGTVELQTGEVGEDFAYYFTLSEQVPTAISVGVLVNEDYSVKSSGILVIQMLPDATEADISYCEHIINGLKPISTLFSEVDSPRQLLDEIFGEDIEILDQQELEFSCSCSRQGMISALLTVEEKDLKEMIEVDKGCEIVCNYCNKKYKFTAKVLEKILDLKKKKN